jgi:outer membrane murein-binding lipoprotein Lpp
MNGKKLAVGAAIVALLALGGGVAIAAQQQGPEPKIDQAAAEEAALDAVAGEVKETELEREGGAAVYEVEVAGTDGKLHEVAVSASDGKVLGQETEEDEGSEEEDDASENEGDENEGPEDEGPEDGE